MPSDHAATRSTAAIAGHPIHPLLVPFPIAFLVGALLCDLAFWRTADLFWVRGSKYLLAAGIVMAAVAAIAGLIDFVTISRVRSLAAAWVHAIGNATAVVIAIWNLVIRWGDPGTVILPMGIVLSAVVVVIFVVTGWLGGELVFRHRIGMITAASDPEPISDFEATAIRGADLSYAGGRGPQGRTTTKRTDFRP